MSGCPSVSNCSHCMSACLLFRVRFLLGFSLGFRGSPILQLFVSLLHQRLGGLPRPVLEISERLVDNIFLIN